MRSYPAGVGGGVGVATETMTRKEIPVDAGRAGESTSGKKERKLNGLDCYVLIEENGGRRLLLCNITGAVYIRGNG